MAKKLFNPLEDPPSATSSDDDDLETSSGKDEEQISDSSSEDEDPAKIPSTQTLETPSASPGKTAVSAAVKQGSVSDSGSETDSDSETEPSGKAIAVSAAKPKKKEGSDSPAVKSGKKRPKEGTSTDMQVKRAKKVSGDDEKKNGEDNKKALFQRIWSEEDEVSLLQGMIDFKADTGKSPSDDMNRFYEVVKNSISFEVSKNQFGHKIRGLKKKYMGNQKKKGVESSHDKKCLGLAKCVWGSDGMALESGVKSLVKSKRIEKKKLDSKVGEEEEDNEVLGCDGMGHESVVKSNGKSKKNEKKKLDSMVEEEEDKEVLIHGGDSQSTNWFEKSFVVRSIASIGVDEFSVKRKWSKVQMKTKKRIEEKCKLVEAKEFELMLLKTDILKEVASAISETS